MYWYVNNSWINYNCVFSSGSPAPPGITSVYRLGGVMSPMPQSPLIRSNLPRGGTESPLLLKTDHTDQKPSFTPSKLNKSGGF